MTVIAAAIDEDGTVWMGADGVLLEGDDCVRRDKHPKVFLLDDFLIGGSGGRRAIQLMRYMFTPPPVEGQVDEYMVKRFAAELRTVMKDNGGECDSEEDGGDTKTLMDAGFLVAVDGELFEVDSAYSVTCPQFPFHAIGCAKQEALAAMLTATQLGVRSAKKIVELGLMAAAEFDVNIRPPFSILRNGADKPVPRRPPDPGGSTKRKSSD
jgi:ATP-dependent protease HslVU (ClpYQ) peptidase subunit